MLQVTVNFDLDLGPIVHSIYPNIELSHAETQNMSVKVTVGNECAES
jgi:hypothetical protein